MHTKLEITGIPSQLIAQSEASQMAGSFKSAVRGFAESALGSQAFVLKYEYKAEFVGGDGKPFVRLSIEPTP